MNLQENIRRVLREETQIPSSIRRRVTNSDIEEAFLKALDSIDYSRLHNQFSPIKNISLKTFAKLVIDEMTTDLEQDYFSDNNRIYFDNDEIYHEKIRVPLMNYFGNRIKKRYNNDKSEEELTEKWTEKYKKSINCNNPKGFSQRAHCQGKGKHSEMKEGELTEKCWAGYTQKGMKTMFGKQYPNCVKKTK